MPEGRSMSGQAATTPRPAQFRVRGGSLSSAVEMKRAFRTSRAAGTQLGEPFRHSSSAFMTSERPGTLSLRLRAADFRPWAQTRRKFRMAQRSHGSNELDVAWWGRFRQPEGPEAVPATSLERCASLVAQGRNLKDGWSGPESLAPSAASAVAMLSLLRRLHFRGIGVDRASAKADGGYIAYALSPRKIVGGASASFVEIEATSEGVVVWATEDRETDSAQVHDLTESDGVSKLAEAITSIVQDS